MKLSEKFGLAGGLAFIVVAIAGFIGWVMNIVQLATQYDSLSTGLLIVKAVGVFLAPLGAVMGYI